MKYAIALLALSLNVSAVEQLTLLEQNHSCLVYGTLAEKPQYIITHLEKAAGDWSNLTAAYHAGLAEGRVIGGAMYIKAATYDQAILASANKWYDFYQCFIPKTI